MLRFDHYGDPLRGSGSGNRFSDLLGEALLDLEAPREGFNDAWDFAQPDHLLVRQVANMAMTKEREKVMLTKAVKLNIFDDHHLIVLDGEQSVVEECFGIYVIAAGEEFEYSLDPLWSLEKSLTFRVCKSPLLIWNAA